MYQKKDSVTFRILRKEVKTLNYYWWKDVKGHAGNVYAETEKEAKELAESHFGEKVTEVELLEKEVEINRLTGKAFKS